MIEIITEGNLKETSCGNCGCKMKYDVNSDVMETSASEKIGGVYVNVFRKVLSCPQCGKDIVLNTTYKSQVTGEIVSVNPEDFTDEDD